jgi:hypothetical protein
VELEISGKRPARLADPVSLAAYRIVQESLTNARRHAAGAAVRVKLGFDAVLLSIAVENGAGAWQSGNRAVPGVGSLGCSSAPRPSAARSTPVRARTGFRSRLSCLTSLADDPRTRRRRPSRPHIPPPALTKLTDRERDILLLIARGREIFGTPECIGSRSCRWVLVRSASADLTCQVAERTGSQGRPARAERSEPRSRVLDGREAEAMSRLSRGRWGIALAWR